jgi:transcriptional regulator with XRE-family HTH domain
MNEKPHVIELNGIVRKTLRELIIDSKLTQKELAEKSGVCETTIMNIKANRNKPRKETAELITKAIIEDITFKAAAEILSKK